MVEINVCPVCQSTSWQKEFDVKDYSISKENFKIKECTTCTLRVTSPRPSDEALSLYYKSEDYISHSGKSNNLINSLYLIARDAALNKKLTLANKLQRTKTVLDIGCGTGEFLNKLKTSGWSISGVELDESARHKAEELNQIKFYKNINEISGQYSLITLWHVLEHISGLDNIFSKIDSALDETGTLLIAVPNHKSQDCNQYKKYWAGYDVPRHLWHFNQQSMVLLLQKYGFKLKQTIPMKLDAYYVSMLSEKYKGNGPLVSLINGAINGLRSNIKARSSSEYSSLIYIATK